MIFEPQYPIIPDFEDGYEPDPDEAYERNRDDLLEDVMRGRPS